MKNQLPWAALIASVCLPRKPDPGRHRVMGLQQRGGVYAGAKPVLGKAFRQAARQGAQARTQQLVVVASPGVLGDASGLRLWLRRVTGTGRKPVRGSCFRSLAGK